MSSWIQTHSGGQFDVHNPRAQDVCLEDIGHSLSMQCRYNGHCEHFYSVAEHSVIVAVTVACKNLLRSWLSEIKYAPGEDALQNARNLMGKLFPPKVYVEPNFGLIDALEFFMRHRSMLDSVALAEVQAALMHDGTEAYLKDLPSPIKRTMPDYKIIESNVEKVVFERFGLSRMLPLATNVHFADSEVLFAEKDKLLAHRIVGWGDGIRRHEQIGIIATTLPIPCLDWRGAKKLFLRAAEIIEITAVDSKELQRDWSETWQIQTQELSLTVESRN